MSITATKVYKSLVPRIFLDDGNIYSGRQCSYTRLDDYFRDFSYIMGLYNLLLKLVSISIAKTPPAGLSVRLI